MSLVINWKASTGADKYRIYRSNKKFTNSTLPTDIVEVDKTTLSKEYLDAVRNTTYWFMISSVDVNGIETLGTPFPVGYFPETGPGPQTILRGDWEFGFFGEVNVTDVLTRAQIVATIALTGKTLTLNPTLYDKYLKVIVAGKILFIPNNYISYNSISASTEATDYVKTHGIEVTRANSLIMTSNGWDYMYRLPNASKDPAKYFASAVLDFNSDDYIGSEAAMLAGLFNNISQNPALVNSLNVGAPATKYHLGDMVMTLYPPVAALNPANSKSLYGIQSNGSIAVVSGTTMRFWPVLELML